MKTHHALATPFRVAAIFSILVLAIVLGNTRVSAQATPNPPDRMTYQGFLTDANGVPLGETAPQNYDVIFRIHNDQSGGQVVWGEQQTVTVDKGYFSVLLGEGADTGDPRNALSTVFAGDDASDRYVGMTVKGIGSGGSDVDILPRLRLLSSPYTFLAKNSTALVSPNGTALVTTANGELTIDGVVNASSVNASSITGSGAGLTGLTASQIPNLNASKITSGTISTARLPNFAYRSGGNTFSGTQRINSWVGINKSPGVWLDIAGNFKVSNANGSYLWNGYGPGGGKTLLAIYTGLNGNGPQVRFTEVGGVYSDIGQDGAGNFVIEQNDVPRLTVGANGLVGVNAAASGYNLNVGGSMYASGNAGFGGYFPNVRMAVKSIAGQHGVYIDNSAGPAYGIYSTAGAAWAGIFVGNTQVQGILVKSAGTFRIDHPLDPENKWLSHSFVESPDMMNVYNGNIVTDSNGDATVTLPDYFEALNKDFRYQLTVIGQFAQAMVAREVSDNKFVIKTDKPEVKVSWQVTGIRHDAFAEEHRIIPETSKTGDEIGTYQHPLEHGQPKSKGMKLPNIKKEKK